MMAAFPYGVRPMRVDVVIKEKKKDGVGVGLLLLIFGLFALAYFLGGPEISANFPRSVEKALTSFRAEADKIIDSVGLSLGEIYRMVAGH
jgi:hypothetical protein